MRYLIISDVHANIDALETVLEDASGAWDRLVVLGDLAGYGGDPNGVIDRVRGLDPLTIIRGNHDKVACGIDDGAEFNHIARAAASWTAAQLTEDNRAYLRALPEGPLVVDDGIEICHGAPYDEDHYIFDSLDALRAIEILERPVCFFGHTHLPVVFTMEGDTFAVLPPDGRDELRLDLQPAVRYLVNPGSVGQPRDGDPRAGYAISSGALIVMRRVVYPVDRAQRRILSAGLPASLANRLALGR